MTDPEIRKGLAGVVVDETAISKVNPETNSLMYRGYPVPVSYTHLDVYKRQVAERLLVGLRVAVVLFRADGAHIEYARRHFFVWEDKRVLSLIHI